MATIKLTKGGGIAPANGWQKFAAQELIDFAASNAAASDVIQAINVPEGTLITNVRVMVVVAEGGTLTFDVGDGADPNGYDDAVNGNATAGTITNSASGTDAYATANGKYYTAADTIDLTLDHAADAAKILVIAEGLYVENATVKSTL